MNFSISFIDPVLFSITSLLLLWLIVVCIFYKAYLVRKNDKTVIVEYEPPKNISPVFARFLMVSGREGGSSSEVSVRGNQLLTMINLYEDGLLKKLIFVDDLTVEYEISDNYQSLICAEEEMFFLKILDKQVGRSGRLQGRKGRHETGRGYIELTAVWFEFWQKYLYELALARGYMQKETESAFFLSLFASSLVFGVFFAVFFGLIPVVGIPLAIIILSPVLLVCIFGYLIFSPIFSYFHLSLMFTPDLQTIFFVLWFVSWFIWVIMLSRSVSKLTRKITPLGLEVIRRLKGYELYLTGVDRERLSFSLNRDNDFSRNRTSFSWLGVFGLLTDKHWDEWRRIAS